MDKETIVKLIELTDTKYRYYYEEAKRVGGFDAVKEQECIRTACALKELKDEMWEIYQRF